MKEELKTLKSNWFIIIFIGSLIVGWTTFSIRLSNVEAMAKDNETSLEQVEKIKTNVYLLCLNNNLDCIK